MNKGRNKETNKGMNTAKSWFNLHGKLFTEDNISWYNLSTSRMIKKPKHDVFSIKGVRIVGSCDNINEFISKNREKNSSITKDSIFKPFSDIKFLSEDASRISALCFSNYAGTIIPPTNNTDVSLISKDSIDRLCKFSFSGHFLKAKVVKVVDGDTLDIIIYMPLTILGCAKNLDGEIKTSALVSTGFENVGFFSIVTIRLYGYDAAEKDTEPGKIAKKLLTEKLTLLNNIIWCRFIERTVAVEKYGRQLAVIFEDVEQKRCLNCYLYDKQQEPGIPMLVAPYTGGTKQKI